MNDFPLSYPPELNETLQVFDMGTENSGKGSDYYVALDSLHFKRKLILAFKLSVLHQKIFIHFAPVVMIVATLLYSFFFSRLIYLFCNRFPTLAV